MIGSSRRPSEDHAFPYIECEWAAAITSGRAAWICEWMANAAVFTGRPPCTTSPRWFTRSRSETRMWPKYCPKGFTQKWSVSSGSRAVTCPATPSSNP